MSSDAKDRAEEAARLFRQADNLERKRPMDLCEAAPMLRGNAQPRESGLSVAMADVLRACLQAGGSASVAQLVRRSGRSVRVARASLSRTLRRLWLRGLVELEDDWGHPLTQGIASIEQDLARHERDPDEAFRCDREARALFPYATAREYLDVHRREARTVTRYRRTRRARVTVAGRQVLARLTARRRDDDRP